MQMNKTYLYAGIGLVAAAGLTAWFVINAPQGNGGAKDNGDSPTMAKPRSLAIDSKGDIVVVDSKNNRLWIQKMNGEVVKKVGKLGTGEGLFREPCGVAVGKDGSIYVADTFYTTADGGGLPWGRVQKFNKDYKFKAVFAKPEHGSADLFGPRDIAVDPSGNVWLSDTGNHRLVKYDADGKSIASIGKKGKGKGEFVEPFGITFDAQGNVYVADRLNYRVQVLDGNGQYLREIKIAGWEDTQINFEPYLAIDNNRGYLYVSDPTKKKVHRYALNGTGHKELTKFDGGEFSQPTGLATAPDGTLLVSDGNLARVVTLKP